MMTTRLSSVARSLKSELRRLLGTSVFIAACYATIWLAVYVGRRWGTGWGVATFYLTQPAILVTYYFVLKPLFKKWRNRNTPSE